MSTKVCPLCKKSLSLQQVNLNLAVYICEDLNCKYPVGYDCKVVDRNLEDIDKNTDNLAGKDRDLDGWIHNVVANDPPPPVPSVSVDLTKVEHQNPNEWIDDLVEEAVNEARRYESVKEASGREESPDVDFDEFLNLL